jgi:M3 family oligoendopeptidase
MLNLKTIHVEKIEKDELLADLDHMVQKIKLASTYTEFISHYTDYLNKVYHFATQYQVTMFRYFGDTSQVEWQQLYIHYTQMQPEVETRSIELKKFTGKSPFIEDLRKEFGDNLYFDCIYSHYDINDRAKSLLQEEKKLSKELVEFKSQSKVDWEGERIAVNKLYSYAKHPDRMVRKKALDDIADYHTKNKEFFYNQLIQLINIRNEFAREVGFDSFVEYSIVKWNRIGYGYTELAQYRDSVVKHFKEIFKLIYDSKKKNLRQDNITYYDNNYFHDGFPQLTEEQELATINNLKPLLASLSPVWLSFYEEMLKADSIDFMPRENKVNMGYASYLMESETPIIYSLLQNNYDDVRVLTHEFGHTLQFIFTWQNNPKKYFIEGTLDTIEIFSHSMEMLCLQGASHFFGKDDEKYKIQNYAGHLTQALTCAMGDEFQEKIYKLKDLNINSIQTVYKELQEKYTGNFFDSSENDYYINGDKWMELDHYFGSPFYLVDYSLAIINALNIYKIYKQNPARGIEIWETLAKNLANLNYKNITNLAPELRSPFDSSYIEETAKFAIKEFSDLLSSYHGTQPAS